MTVYDIIKTRSMDEEVSVCTTENIFIGKIKDIPWTYMSLEVEDTIDIIEDKLHIICIGAIDDTLPEEPKQDDVQSLPEDIASDIGTLEI